MIIQPSSSRPVNGLFDDLLTAGTAAASAIQSGKSGADALKAAGQSFAQTESGQQAVSYVSDTVRGQILDNLKQAAFYSAYSKPYVYTGKDLADLVTGKIQSLVPGRPAPPPPAQTRAGQVVQKVEAAIKSKSLIERVKPTIIIEGSFGRKVIAPYGEASPTEWQSNIRNLVIGAVGVLAIYTAGAYYLGYKKGQRSRI